ncbi:GNAT family N-acetyltransferase [Roseibium denhamense]
MTDMLNLRAAQTTDCEALAGIHNEAWLGAYRGVLNGLDLQKLISRRSEPWWQGALARGVNIQILAVSETPAGYATFGPCRLKATGMEGEIYELYLKPEYQGLGFGRALFEHVRTTLANRSLSGLAIQVLSENEPARAFYRAMGGSRSGTSWYKIGSRRLEISIYTWPDRSHQTRAD